MSLHTSSLAKQIAAIEKVIVSLRASGARSSAEDSDVFEAVKAIAADLRARQNLPNSNALTELERVLFRMRTSKTALGYDDGKMIAVANVVVHNWPTIRQALERFGEESAE